MKNRTFMGLSVILFGLLCSSCTVTHQIKSNTKESYSGNGPQFWEMTVRVLNNYNGFNLPRGGSEIKADFEFSDIFSYGVINRGYILKFRLRSLEQVKQLEYQLNIFGEIVWVHVNSVNNQL